MLAKMHSNWSSQKLLVTLRYNEATWKNILAASYQVTIHSSNPTSKFYQREVSTEMSTQNLHANVLAALLIISKNWK